MFQQEDSVQNAEVQINQESVVKSDINELDNKTTDKEETYAVSNSSAPLQENAIASVSSTVNNSSDVYGNLGSSNGGASIILGAAPLFDVTW